MAQIKIIVYRSTPKGREVEKTIQLRGKKMPTSWVRSHHGKECGDTIYYIRPYKGNPYGSHWVVLHSDRFGGCYWDTAPASRKSTPLYSGFDRHISVHIG